MKNILFIEKKNSFFFIEQPLYSSFSLPLNSRFNSPKEYFRRTLNTCRFKSTFGIDTLILRMKIKLNFSSSLGKFSLKSISKPLNDFNRTWNITNGSSNGVVKVQETSGKFRRLQYSRKLRREIRKLIPESSGKYFENLQDKGKVFCSSINSLTESWLQADF